MNVQRIFGIVCDYHGVAVSVVLAGQRSALTVAVRRQTAALAREFTGASLANIAEVLHLSQEASVSEALRRHGALIAHTAIYARDFRALRAAIKACIDQETP